MRLSAGPMPGQVLSKRPAYLVNGHHHEDVEGISTEDEDGAFFFCALGKLAHPLSPVDRPCVSSPAGVSFVLSQPSFCLC